MSGLQWAKASMMCVTAAAMVDKATAMSARAAEMTQKMVVARALMAENVATSSASHARS
jgi:hypothetical protein